VFQTVAWRWGIDSACHIQRVTYIIGRIGDTPLCERHSQKAQVKNGIGRHKDGVGRAEEFDEVGDNLFNGGLSPDHTVGNAVDLLDIPGNGYVRIDERLEGCQLVAVRSEAYRTNFDQPVHDRVGIGGLSIELIPLQPALGRTPDLPAEVGLRIGRLHHLAKGLPEAVIVDLGGHVQPPAVDAEGDPVAGDLEEIFPHPGVTNVEFGQRW
jgi:hypothetical protein